MGAIAAAAQDEQSPALRADGRRNVRLIPKVAQRPNSGHEEVGTTACGDKTRQALVALPHRLRRCRERCLWLMIGHQRIRLVVQAVEGWVVDPRLLDHLELSADIGADAEE